MAIFGKKNLVTGPKDLPANLQIILAQSINYVKDFEPIEYLGMHYTAQIFQDDIKLLLHQSFELNDLELLWWVTKISSVVSDQGTSLSTRGLAKNTL